MNITITATLSEEQLDILAAYKGFTEGSREEFIRDIYKELITSDATNIFIDYSRRKTEQERIDAENAIREEVKASISSSIE